MSKAEFKRLMHDCMLDSNLIESVKSNPEAVASEYNLTAEEYDVLRSGAEGEVRQIADTSQDGLIDGGSYDGGSSLKTDKSQQESSALLL